MYLFFFFEYLSVSKRNKYGQLKTGCSACIQIYKKNKKIPSKAMALKYSDAGN